MEIGIRKEVVSGAKCGILGQFNSRRSTRKIRPLVSCLSRSFKVIGTRTVRSLHMTSY